jgi:DNA-binding GntR family transcriptional regulator
MADEHRTRTTQDAERVAQWLVENRAEFEGQGISEDKIAPALGMTSDEITEAIDHLEAREEVVRIPQALTTPPQFLLKPGRGWIDARDEMLGSGNGT